MRKNSIKNTRINEEVMRAICEIIQNEIKDPRIQEMTSVTKVIVAPDLKTCKVFVSVLGDDEKKEKTMAGLRSASSFMRRRLATDLNLRITPELAFIPDDSIEYGVRMSRLIDDIQTRTGTKEVENEKDI